MGMLLDLANLAGAGAGIGATKPPIALHGDNGPRIDPAAEARRQRVLAMLADHPTARYAALTDMQADPEVVILTLAVRGRATCDLRIPREKWDGVLFLELLERHCGTIH
jgi:hypothetical protein